MQSEVVTNTIAVEPTSGVEDRPGLLADFYELTKPRMNFLVVVTSVVGFYVASKVSGMSVASWVLVHSLIGTALTAASASVLNQIIERDFDKLMPRTRNRPLAASRLGVSESLLFAAILGVVGVTYLALAVNLLTAFLGLFTLLTYVLIYTPMKRRSSWCTLVGAVPGAIPPVMGVTSVGNVDLAPLALALFAILFVWQMPHFFALALMYKRDYEAGGFRMLPSVVDGDRRTRQQIVLFSGMLIPVSLTPLFSSQATWLYAIAAGVLGVVFVKYAIACAARRAGAERKLFFWSILYLPLLLAVLMLDVTI